MPSRTTSRHHWYMVKSIRVRPMARITKVLKWNHAARPDVSRKAAAAPVKGQGLGSTMWKA